MVMHVMNTIETFQVSDAQETAAVMVLPVVNEGEVVVARVKTENEQACHIAGEREPREQPDRHGYQQEDEDRRGDERRGGDVMLRMTAPDHRRWAMSEPAM